jgi:Glucose / Sorbosone dehydrogenase
MRAALLAVTLVLLAAAPASAAPELVKIGDFTAPVHVASPPQDTRVFVVEQTGTIKIAGGGTFLDLTGPTTNGGERGLLSMAFAPDYATSGRFYVFLTSEPNGDVEVREYQRSAADPNVADPTLLRTLLDEPHSATNHNGGQLQFGPDGALYVSIGDNANAANAQTTGSPFGKILRIDTATGATQVWSSGLRNPWRFTFDRPTGDLLIGDVGDGSWEEVDWVRAPNAGSGVNFGWPCREGGSPHAGSCSGAVTEPAFSRSHGDGYQAIIGGYVVRDPGLPTLSGRYLYGDAALSSLRSVSLPDSCDRAEPLPIAALSSFGEDACGRLYAASLDGPVYRIQDGAPTPCSFPAAPQAADVTAPGLRVRILRLSLQHRRLRLAVRCSEACRVAIASRLRGVRKLKVRRRSLAAGERKVVRIKLSRRLTRRVRGTLRRRGFVRMAVTVRAVDAAGNRRAVTRRGRLRR